MPELREAYETYFDEALSRSNEEVGFSGAFARAAEARTADKFSNLYTDLGLLAKNTKSIMLDASQKLLKAIDKAVVYNKRGADLKSKGISTYYPYISSERPPEESVDATNANFNEGVLSSNSNYIAQKELYQKLLGLEKLPASEDLPIEKINAHFVAKLTPEQLENISSVRCMLVPVEKGETSGYDLDLGGAILTSADLSELIAKSSMDYIKKAVHLGRHKELTAAYHAGLREHLLQSKLMDGERYVREVEKCYREAWKIFCESMPENC